MNKLPTLGRAVPAATLLTAALLATAPARAQTAPADTAQARLLANIHSFARFQFGEMFGLGISMVNQDEDYYLPNDGVKFGSEVAFHGTYYFSKKLPLYGLRLGVGLLGRSGRFTFGQQQVRRNDALLTVPLEFVVRTPWLRHPGWYSTVSLGGYFSELAQRYTYRLDPLTGKTLRTTDSWLYGVGGMSFSVGIGRRTGTFYREVGVRASNDLTGLSQQFDPSSLPNLRASNFSVYLSIARGR
ncbi:MAG: hypothetical protein EOO57_01730 [Hymenobacter sp.]|nr:MAG: hypothetical protein EOO57_01730 [Hymenobacter sp.]